MSSNSEKPNDMQYHILATVKKTKATVTTDKGSQESRLHGQLLFSVKKTATGIELYLERMNFTGSSVGAKEGKTGLLSLSLKKRAKAIYSKDGQAQAELETILHYPLIDKTKGYRQLGQKEPDNFIPFVATAHGKIKARFKPRLEDVQAKKLEEKRVQLSVSFDLATKEYYVKAIAVADIVVSVSIIIRLAFFNQLNIQPVFIRSGPTDTSPTGWSFDTMMQSAKCIWRKCCVFFNVRTPVYVDKNDYKVLGSLNEAINLLNEVNVDDAVEIFVVSRWDPIWDGCGASFSSGTANAKIVTCDEQLKVPDPNNPGGYLGAINVNHLAHELGHVISLVHPGDVVTPPMTAAATANTVMEPSGFYADNPHQQSMNNCNNVASPLFRLMIMLRDYRCVRNPEIP
jgi:hypothetical protein